MTHYCIHGLAGLGWAGWLGWEEEETGPLSRSGMTREGARGKPGELPASLYNEQAGCPRSRCRSHCGVKGGLVSDRPVRLASRPHSWYLPPGLMRRSVPKSADPGEGSRLTKDRLQRAEIRQPRRGVQACGVV